mgnify:CR=1 FL=1
MNTLEKWKEMQKDKAYWENEKHKKAQEKRKKRNLLNLKK